MRKSRWILGRSSVKHGVLLVLLSWGLTACAVESERTGQPDVGGDVGSDVGEDGGSDVGEDGGSDVAEDGGSDAEGDVGPGELNACGGTAALDQAPGGFCGPCGLDVVQCDGEDAVKCSGETACPELLIETLAVQDVDANGATFHGQVSELPLDAVTDHGFCFAYGDDEEVCRSLGALSEVGAFSLVENELFPGRNYSVRAYAGVESARVFGAGVAFSTSTVAVTGLSASAGESTEHVELGWDAIEGAESYIVYRDGEEIARVDGEQNTYLDGLANAGSAPSMASGVVATQGTFSDRVQVSWDAASMEPGASHSYWVVAAFPDAESAESDAADGFRGAYEISHYELSPGGAVVVDVGLALSHSDLAATPGKIIASEISASRASVIAHVALNLTGQASVTTNGVAYIVRAVSEQAGAQVPGAWSDEVSGYRGVEAVGLQWEESAGDSEAGFSAIAGAIAGSFEHAGAPADGSARYYRARFSGTGAADVYSESVRGYRAVAGQVAMVSVDPDTTLATFHGNVTVSGESTTDGLGFCFHETNPAPSHANGAICLNAEQLIQQGAFQVRTTYDALTPGTRYNVRAFVSTNAVDSGYVYSAAQTFASLTDSVYGVTAVGSIESIAVNWETISGAAKYQVFRNDVVVGTVIAPATSFTDSGAGAGGLPTAPALTLTNTNDHIQLSWNSPTVSPGPMNTYKIAVLNDFDLASSVTSEAQASRLGALVTGFELEVDSGEGFAVAQTLGAAALSFSDTSAAAGVITAAQSLSASAGTRLDSVSLSSAAAISGAGAVRNYRVHAINPVGRGAFSDAKTGRRSVGAISSQWEVSASDSAAGFAAISGATALTFEHLGAPADGSGRHYRVRNSATGVDTVYSASVRGFRAVQGEVETLAAHTITSNSATLRGQLIVVGVPAPAALGFCYHATNPTPDHANGAACVNAALLTTAGPYEVTTSTALTAGTQYHVRAFVRTNAVGAGYAYGSAQTFVTRTAAVQSVTAVGAIESIAVSWGSVSGAAKYQVYRDGILVSTVVAPTTTFSDASAVAGGVPAIPTLAITNSDTSLQLSWNSPATQPGALHSYKVVALNSGDLASADSGLATAKRLAAPVSGFELEVDSGAGFVALGNVAGSVLSYSDTSAAAGAITFIQGMSATRGTFVDRVDLNADGATSSAGAVRQYRVRAINAAGQGDFSQQKSGQRSVGALSYQWERSESGANVFAAVGACGANLLCSDSGASEDGSEYDYRLVASASGAATARSATVEGSRAFLSLSFVNLPTDMEPGVDSDVVVELRNQYELVFPGITVSLALLKDSDAGFEQDLGQKVISASGQASVVVRTGLVGDDFLVEGKFLIGQVAYSDLFSVAYGPAILASMSEAGDAKEGSWDAPTISGNGRYVVFESNTMDRLPGDNTWSPRQIYRKDLETGKVALVSSDANGVKSDDGANETSVSHDGRYVTFNAWSGNLVPGVSGLQIYRKDLESGSIELVSKSAAGVAGNAYSYRASISGDGHYVVFFTESQNLVVGGGPEYMIVRKDMTGGSIVPVSTNANGVWADHWAHNPVISADGRYVAFESNAQNFLPTQTGDPWATHIYRKDLQSGAIVRVSETEVGISGNNNSHSPSMSADGRYVAFVSYTSNLAGGLSTNGYGHIYRKDIDSGQIMVASVNTDGIIGDDYHDRPTISADGRYVAFEASSSSLVPGVSNQTSNVFRKDMNLGNVVVASSSAAGESGNNYSSSAHMSADGSAVVFTSYATNIVTCEQPNDPRVFVRRFAP